MMTTKENTMTDFNTVLSFVTLDATQDQLENLMEAMKFRREKLSKLAKYSFKAGMPVVFDVLCHEIKGLGMNIQLEKQTTEANILL
jgi:DNA-directed RNA polymerase beta subunit